MCADCMTKCDPARGHLALYDMMCRGTLTLVDEFGHLSERSMNLDLKSRSRAASMRALSSQSDSSGGSHKHWHSQQQHEQEQAQELGQDRRETLGQETDGGQDPVKDQDC